MKLSSRSPKRFDVAIIGEKWKVGVAAEFFRETSCNVIALSTSSTSGLEAIHVGTGDCFERARLLFGDSLAESLWNFSEENYALAKEFLDSRSIPYSEKGLLRITNKKNERESLLFAKSLRSGKNKVVAEGLWEPGLTFSLDHFELSVQSTHDLQLLQEEDFLYKLKWENKSAEASTILFLSDKEVWSRFPAMRDKLIAVTLSHFTYHRRGGPPCSAALVNGGADFAFSNGAEWLLGSYRNLYEDRAVGIRDTVDEVTRSGVSTYFSGLGWVDKEGLIKENVSVDAITCDGIPLVGTLDGAPGIFFAGGFAGKAPNFLFLCAKALAQGLSSSENSLGYSQLALFSTKRFV
jgi:hypothetical protein